LIALYVILLNLLYISVPKEKKEDGEFLAIAKADCSLILELMPQKVKVSVLTCTSKVDLFKEYISLFFTLLFNICYGQTFLQMNNFLLFTFIRKTSFKLIIFLTFVDTNKEHSFVFFSTLHSIHTLENKGTLKNSFYSFPNHYTCFVFAW